jgi:hypothetical protein
MDAQKIDFEKMVIFDDRFDGPYYLVAASHDRDPPPLQPFPGH